MAKELKVGARRGKGPPPGYLWTICFLSCADAEAKKVLNQAGYAHALDLMKALASEERPSHPATVDVDAIDDYFELRDKGGILGKINLRIFFTVDSKNRVVLVLGVIKKEADGQTPSWAKKRIAHHLRRFKRGEFGALPNTTRE